MNAARTRLPTVGLLLAGSLCLLPFLMPYHDLPVKSFHSEWLAAVLGTCAALAALADRSGPLVPWPVSARWLLALALFLASRAVWGGPAYPQLPLLAVLYVLYAALMLWLGAQLTKALGIERVAMFLAGFLLAGALLTALIGMIQFYGRPKVLEDVVFELYGSRAYGNIGQPNLYANYLALGECALLFLWLRARVPTPYALAAFTLLVLGSALAGSRSTLMYPIWFIALAFLTGRRDFELRRLKIVAIGLVGATLAADVVVPWINGVFHLGPPALGALDRTLAVSNESGEARLHIWSLALRLFATAPLTGVGVGEFAGAAFDLGLDPLLAHSAELWTSPHNLVLQLLAETGIAGAVLALGALGAWGWHAARSLRAEGNLALWWTVAAVGVELIHSMIEFPLWYAPFLGVTALLMGVGAAPVSNTATISRKGRIAAIAVSVTLGAASLVLLRDYLRLDGAHISGTRITLGRAAEAQRDAATMRGLTHGLMAPLAEYWIVMGLPLDRSDLAAKVAMSGRVARFWPTYATLARQAAFLAFEGETSRSRDLIAQSLRTFPQRRNSIIVILDQAQAADPGVIGPLLALAQTRALH